MQRLEVSGAVRLIYKSLGNKGLRKERRLGMYEIRGMENVWTLEEVTCI